MEEVNFESSFNSELFTLSSFDFTLFTCIKNIERGYLLSQRKIRDIVSGNLHLTLVFHLVFVIKVTKAIWRHLFTINVDEEIFLLE